VLAKRGELDESLRIRREEELPVYERLGDLRARAIALGKIADVLATRGEVDQALTMWRESLAIFERLGEQDLTAIARQRVMRLQTTEGPGSGL
jgi:membrane protein required for beta-lactamase induction